LHAAQELVADVESGDCDIDLCPERLCFGACLGASVLHCETRDEQSGADRRGPQHGPAERHAAATRLQAAAAQSSTCGALLGGPVMLVSGVAPKVARQKALAALETVELSNRATHRPAELSGGQRQRVTIARALVNDPAIVWADEPTGALDSKTATEIMSLMGRLNQEKGLTFVLVTHDHGIGAESDRVVQMRDGEIVDQVIHRPASYVQYTAAD
jgi:ABC-type dipeptide/oligopeptide/nickel transport system ATPase component